MLSFPSPSSSALSLKEREIEETRIHDVQLILENLFYREEATLKIVVDCLYDVGSIHLINQKMKHRSMNRFMKMVARFTKPIVQMMAVRWCKKNCPELITEWLYSQVTLQPQDANNTTVNTPS